MKQFWWFACDMALYKYVLYTGTHVFNSIWLITPPLIEEQSTVMTVSVCLSMSYLSNYMSDLLCVIFCVQYIMYIQFYGWRRVCT